MHRRQLLCGLSVGVISATAGCLDTGLGEDVVSSTPATITDQAASESGYRHVETRDAGERREYGVGPLSQTVELTNWISEYHRGIELPLLGRLEAAVVAVLTTTRVELFGRTSNPVGEMSDREIAEIVQAQYDEISIGDVLEREEIETLGTPTAVTSFEGTA